MILEEACALPDDNELASLVIDLNKIGLGERGWSESTVLKPWAEKHLGEAIPQIPDSAFQAISVGLLREAALRWTTIKLGA